MYCFLRTTGISRPTNFKPNLSFPQILFLTLLFPVFLQAQINFIPSSLNGESINDPTSLDFGPDGRLYVSEQDGDIYAYTILRNSAVDYSVSAIEHIDLVKNIQNFNDDGSLHNPTVPQRQITGLLAVGTAANPVLYVSSSDYRIGGGGGGSDEGLCTNSGIISRLTWDGSQWNKVDLVRGLPRSEENHATNGLQLDEENNILYVAQGGSTNAGSPSNNFAFITEYALAAAILSIDLTAIADIPVNFDPLTNSHYIYDLPTLDDPSRANANGITDPLNPSYTGIDVNDPFGGNDGLNQAKWVIGGPVQVYSPGYRNIYDLVLTEAGRLYTWDNGPNGGWGGHPENEGSVNVTNNWVNGEPGSDGPGPNDDQVNNADGLHFVTGPTYYGGHPNPIRANPTGAGLFTHDHNNGTGGSNGVFRTAYTGNLSTTLPYDWPPVDPSLANSVEADFQNPGEDDLSLWTVKASTNGMVEYTASNFGGLMTGDLLAVSWNDNLYHVSLNAAGSINSESDVTSIASNFSSDPLDVTAQGDSAIFPGTIWVASYGSDEINILEPADFLPCTGDSLDNADEDFDGYTNLDEYDNGSLPCNASSLPTDHDKSLIGGFKVSDLNDPDDDDDGNPDFSDPFALDANNGQGLNLSFNYPLLNNDPGFGLFGLGFTGLMTNLSSDYLELIQDEDNSNTELIAGGAVGLLTFNDVATGSPRGSQNDLKNGFQFGLNTDAASAEFRVEVKLLGPLFQGSPEDDQFQGFFIGNGDQDNYLMMAVNANNGSPVLEFIKEVGGSDSSWTLNVAHIAEVAELKLVMVVDPATGLIQAQVDTGGGRFDVGNPIQLNATLLSTLQSSDALAIGVAAGKSPSAPDFNATWDYIRAEWINNPLGQWSFVHDGSNCSTTGTGGSCPRDGMRLPMFR